jgi:PAS domain S-box-containing protein
MADESPRPKHSLSPVEAARWLNIDEPALRALIAGGYLEAAESGEVTLAEIKSFAARNSEGGSVSAAGMTSAPTDFQVMIEALEDDVEDLSRGAFEMFARSVPEAKQWDAGQREDFVVQARGRFSAVLAVTSQGSFVDDALRQDLEDVGSNAAWAKASLPHLQMVLRISRDLLVQRSMRIAEQHGGRWNNVLGAFTVRLMPAIDNMVDAISSGYWQALLEQAREQHGRLANLVEQVPYGVYQVDLDGLFTSVNPAFASIFGRHAQELVGMSLSDIVKAIGDPQVVPRLLSEPDGGAGQIEFEVFGRDGERVKLDVDTVVLRRDSIIEGFAGIVRIHTGASLPDLSTLARHTTELRRSLEILVDAGVFLERHADDMAAVQVGQAGQSIQRQTRRLLTIVSELEKDRDALSAVAAPA